MEKALEFIPSLTGNHELAAILSHLGSAFSERYSVGSNIDDCSRAIATLARGVEVAPAGFPYLPFMYDNLGRALGESMSRLGRIDDLPEVIRTLRQAVRLFPSDHPRRIVSLCNLARALGENAVRTGQWKDLDSAIRAANEAMTAAQHDPANASRVLVTLGMLLRMRYDIRHTPQDLDHAIAFLMAGAGEPGAGGIMLADAFIQRYRVEGVQQDVETALAILGQALESVQSR